MCALALANFVWNNSKDVTQIGGCQMNVEYETSERRVKVMKYELSGFQLSSDQREFKVSITRGGGGLACRMTVRRASLEEGADIEMTHGTQHVAGLMEKYKLFRKQIKSGNHRNSTKYKGFSGTSDFPDRVTLQCEVKAGKHFVTVPYKLEITSISHKERESK
jgi:hypothetical protein